MYVCPSCLGDVAELIDVDRDEFGHDNICKDCKNGMPPKPEGMAEAHLLYLDSLRVSGRTNMFFAAPYLRDAFQLDRADADEYLRYWMDTFGLRHAD